MELAAGHGGKKKKTRRRGCSEEEENRRWLLVVGWWLRWLPMVELIVGRPLMRVVVAEGHDGERKKEEMCRNREKNGFLADFGPDFPPSGHQRRLYL